MRRLLLLPALLLSACATPSPDQVAPDRVVRFEIDMTDASKDGWFNASTDAVGLRGGISPLSWGSTMMLTDEDANGIWEGEVVFDDDAAVVVPYKVFVEGAGNPNGGWEDGPNRTVNRTTTRVVQRAFNDMTEPPAPTITGTVRRHTGFGSGALVSARDLHVWLPPGYDDDPDRRYPVLYMHDGQNMFDLRDVGGEWGLDETATRLIEDGEIEPVIIVGVANTAERSVDYTPTKPEWRFELVRIGKESGDDPLAGRYQVVGQEGLEAVVRGTDDLDILLPEQVEWNRLERSGDTYVVSGPNITITPGNVVDGRVQQFVAEREVDGGGGRAYARFLVDEVKPFIDATYRTRPDRANTAVGGSSFGGLITMSIGTWYPDVFGGLLVVSPSVWWDQGVLLSMVADGPEADGRRIWLDIGTDEGAGSVDGARALRDSLIAKGWVAGRDLAYVEEAGAGHDEAAWAGRADAMLLFLFGVED